MQTAQGRYAQLESSRGPFLQQARENSKLTIPALIPPEGGYQKLYQPFQSMGARGVNNLASKLLLALLPPNQPFFRLLIDELTVSKQQIPEEALVQLDQALGKIERAVQKDMASTNDRNAIFEAMKHLIVGGNACLYIGAEGTKLFPLTSYVCNRDFSGNVLEIITREKVGFQALPEEIQGVIREKYKDAKDKPWDSEVDIYTWAQLKNGYMEWYQEVCGEVVPKSKGRAKADEAPWIVLRFTRIDGEDYGRGYVEDYMGDLRSLEALSQAIVEGSAAVAKILFLVNPNGTTRASSLATAPNGAIVSGTRDDVSVLQSEKQADLGVARATADGLQQNLAFAFLLNSAVQRNAERVTREEIRFMAEELESALGGIYSLLTQEFQLPLVRRKMALMQKKGKLPALPKEIVAPAISTGLEAIGRGQDRNTLMEFLGSVQQALGPQAMAQYINVPVAIARLAAAGGIDPQGLIKSPQEIAQEQQQAMMMQSMQALGPSALQGGAKLLGESLKQQGAPAPNDNPNPNPQDNQVPQA